MRFLVDECTGPAVALWLRDQGHEVFSVYDEGRGTDDSVLIRKAYIENWILISNDKGFGEKVFRLREPHHGVILMRLEDERSSAKIEALRQLLAGYSDQLTDRFVVVTETKVRFARL